MTDKREMRVVESTTGKVVHRVDVSGKDDRHAEKVMSGMLRNMDTGTYHVEDSADDEPAPSIPTPKP
jgi:hypothetical protein